jgi:TIR domain
MRIFVSYANKDIEYLKELRGHIKQENCYGCEVWDDDSIKGGNDIDDEIGKKIRTSDFVLLLISNEFVNSIFCYEKEFLVAYKRHLKSECEIIPIFLSKFSIGDKESNLNDIITIAGYPDKYFDKDEPRRDLNPGDDPIAKLRFLSTLKDGDRESVYHDLLIDLQRKIKTALFQELTKNVANDLTEKFNKLKERSKVFLSVPGTEFGRQMRNDLISYCNSERKDILKKLMPIQDVEVNEIINSFRDGQFQDDKVQNLIEHSFCSVHVFDNQYGTDNIEKKQVELCGSPKPPVNIINWLSRKDNQNCFADPKIEGIEGKSNIIDKIDYFEKVNDKALSDLEDKIKKINILMIASETVIRNFDFKLEFDTILKCFRNSRLSEYLTIRIYNILEPTNIGLGVNYDGGVIYCCSPKDDYVTIAKKQKGLISTKLDTLILSNHLNLDEPNPNFEAILKFWPQPAKLNQKKLDSKKKVQEIVDDYIMDIVKLKF